MRHSLTYLRYSDIPCGEHTEDNASRRRGRNIMKDNRSPVLSRSRIVAFVATCDAARAKAFYGDTLGLGCVSEDQFAVVFDAHGTPLRVSIVQEMTPAAHTVLGWEVDDIAAV